MSWQTCCNHVLPHLFRLEAERGSGSGVFIGYNEVRSLAAIATAAHVLADAAERNLPIILRQHRSGNEVGLDLAKRVIYADRERDSAVILVPAEYLDLPDEALPLLPEGETPPIGSEVGWLGYPRIGHGTLNFFSGRVSASLQESSSYVIDGMCLTGVSGGPLFEMLPDDSPRLLGVMRLYVINTDRPTPAGISLATDASHLHEAIKAIRSLDR